MTRLQTSVLTRGLHARLRECIVELELLDRAGGLRFVLTNHAHFTAKNVYYASFVPMVRDGFLADELVRIDCKGLPKSDYRKIGVKLRVSLLYSLMPK